MMFVQAPPGSFDLPARAVCVEKKMRDVFPVLGHRLDNRGSAWPCWEATKRSMWGLSTRHVAARRADVCL